jgi:hypothetical protein
VFIAAARALGIPARYVSGYLLMDDRVDQDAGHAWAEAFVANLGWVGSISRTDLSRRALRPRGDGRRLSRCRPITASAMAILTKPCVSLPWNSSVWNNNLGFIRSGR